MSIAQWELFRPPELECFQAMLNRLHRQELEELVMDYEAYRMVLQREILRREMEAAQQSQQQQQSDSCVTRTKV